MLVAADLIHGASDPVAGAVGLQILLQADFVHLWSTIRPLYLARLHVVCFTEWHDMLVRP